MLSINLSFNSPVYVMCSVFVAPSFCADNMFQETAVGFLDVARSPPCHPMQQENKANL